MSAPVYISAIVSIIASPFMNAKILIVDDEESVCKILKKIFSRHSYETEAALNGFEAGIKLLTYKPDILILDLIMPGMDGFEVCKMRAQHNKQMAISLSHCSAMFYTAQMPVSFS